MIAVSIALSLYESHNRAHLLVFTPVAGVVGLVVMAAAMFLLNGREIAPLAGRTPPWPPSATVVMDAQESANTIHEMERALSGSSTPSARDRGGGGATRWRLAGGGGARRAGYVAPLGVHSVVILQTPIRRRASAQRAAAAAVRVAGDGAVLLPKQRPGAERIAVALEAILVDEAIAVGSAGRLGAVRDGADVGPGHDRAGVLDDLTNPLPGQPKAGADAR